MDDGGTTGISYSRVKGFIDCNVLLKKIRTLLRWNPKVEEETQAQSRVVIWQDKGVYSSPTPHNHTQAETLTHTRHTHTHKNRIRRLEKCSKAV